MDELFRDAHRKIKRANHHIHDLNAVFDSFLSSDFYGFSAKRDSDTGQCVLEYSVVPMPEEVPLILGDALHNLRTSLDFVATEITHRAGRSTDFSNFPIRKTREKVVAAINGGLVQAAPASVVSVILDKIKPYKGGNDSIWALHDLDMIDKHFLVVPTVSLTTVRGVDLAFSELRMHDCTLIAEAGNQIRLKVGSNAELQVNNKGKPTCQIVFANHEVFGMQPVIPTLHDLSQLVSSCVDALAKAYLTSI